MGIRAEYGNSKPLISVIVPVYNRKDKIRACIESLLSQTYPSELTEIIIIDNNSTDGTDRIIQKYPVILLYERSIQTSYAARNLGILNASGEILAFTDSDCIASPNWLENLCAHFIDPDVGGVVGQINSQEPESLLEMFSDSLFPSRKSIRKNLVSGITGNVAYKKDIITSLGNFDELLFTGGDVDLSNRVQIIAKKRIIIDSKAVVYHKHRSNLKDLFNQHSRFGYSELILATLYRHHFSNDKNLNSELFTIINQCVSLMIYFLAFLKRILSYPFKKYSRFDLLKPGYLFIIEFATIVGKLNALKETQFMHRNPYPSRKGIIR